jgi:hypothetical protein
MKAYLVAHVFTAYCWVFGVLILLCVCQLLEWLSLLVFQWYLRVLTTFKLPGDSCDPHARNP